MVKCSPVKVFPIQWHQYQRTTPTSKERHDVPGKRVVRQSGSFAPCSVCEQESVYRLPYYFSIASHLVRTEQPGHAVFALVCLQSLEQRRSVMQHGGRGVEVQRRVRLDLRCAPTSSRVPRDADHCGSVSNLVSTESTLATRGRLTVVGEFAAKDQLGRLWDLLRVLCKLDLES